MITTQLISFALSEQSEKAAEAVAGLAGAGIMMILIIGFIGLASFGFWLWSLIHCIQNKRLSDTNRTLGLILILVLPLLGSLIYFFLPREKEDQR